MLLTGISAFSQNLLENTLNLKQGQRSIESVLAEMSEKGVNLSYSDNALPLKKTVVVKISQQTLNQHLITIFQDEKVAFEERGQSILIYRSRKRLRKKVTVRGVVADKTTGEYLIGAHIWIDSLELGTTSNEYGFYSLSVPQGDYTLKTSHLGHFSEETFLQLRSNKRVNLTMQPRIPKLDEVVVSSREVDYLLTEQPVGFMKMDMNQLGQISYFLGEVDIQQAAQLKPGISSIGEDAIGLNVRGGTIDQTLILLDEAPIYNSSHLFGLISVFNADALKSTEIHKSSIPVTYGGRPSSVIHVRKREGNDQEYHVTGGTGFASTRLMVEGPIVKDKSSFLLSARSSFTNFSFFEFNDELNFRDNRASFHDINAKFNFRINEKNTIYLSGYFGKDRNRIGDDQLRRWGNNTGTLRWTSQLTPRLFMSSTALFSDYSYRTGKPNKGIGEFAGVASNINYTVKSDFTFFKSPRNSFDFGAGLTLHRINPGDIKPDPSSQTINEISIDSEHGLESYIYLNNTQKISERIQLSIGMRISMLQNVGPGTVFIYEEGESKERETIVDTIRYGSRDVIKRYNGFEPRLGLNYRISDKSALKVSYDRTVQYLQLISNTISPSPTDIWKLSGTHVRPQTGDQLAIGFINNLQDGLELSIELFGKKMHDVLDYKNGADLLLNEAIETELLSGEGRAYGLEFLLNKTSKKFSGWLSYTLSRSERRIRGNSPSESINNGEFYPNDFDQTHDLSLVGIYNLNERWSFSSNFVLRTGRPISLPDGKYEFENSAVPIFSTRNQYRLTSYHRLDLSAIYYGRNSKKSGKPRKVEDYWTFSLYNVYARNNAFSYFFRAQEEDPFKTEVIRYSILGTIIPAITYNFRF